MENKQNRFKELRELLNLSQPAIAEKLGMKVQMWQKLESGRTADPRASTIIHICETFNISANWLLNIDGIATAPSMERLGNDKTR